MKTADPELMRAINRFHVVDAIRRFGPIARVEISERTELSPTTVSAITAALLDDELIVPRPMGTVRDAARGRPRVLLELNPNAARVVGVKITPSRIVHVVTDFQGDVLAELIQPVRVGRQSAEVIADLVEDGVRRCVADAGLALGSVESICVALPGVVEHATGLVRQSPILRDSNVPFGKALFARLGLATLIESDANAITIGEHWFRLCRDLDDFAVVTVEHSLGLGVMHGGELFRGAKGLSFNLGDLASAANGNGHGPIARLADHAAEPAILAPIAERDDALEAVQLGRAMDLVKERIEAGDNELTASALRAGEALGLAIANLITLFAPPKVVLVGSTLVLGESLMAGLLRALEQAVPRWLADVSEVTVDDADDSAWARGAAAAALLELYGAPWGTTGPARPRNAKHVRDREAP
ncbi:MAG: ROK family protein [Propylenella sp.]